MTPKAWLAILAPQALLAASAFAATAALRAQPDPTLRAALLAALLTLCLAAAALHLRRTWRTAPAPTIALLAAALLWTWLAPGAPLLDAIAERADPADPTATGPSGLRTLRNGTELELSGPITATLADQFLTTTARTIQLDSPGGSLAATHRIAKAIRDRGLDTYVGDTCRAACAILFAAGTHRYVGPFASIGYTPSQGPLPLRDTYARAGLPPATLPTIAAVPPGQAWFPTPQQMLDTGLATALAPIDRFALAGFGPNPTQDTIRTRLLSVPLYNAIAQADPAGFTDDVALWTRIILAGQPGTEAFAALRTRIATITRRALPAASLALLQDHAALAIQELQWLQAHQPGNCPAYLDGTLDALDDPDLALQRAALRTRLIATPTTPPPATTPHPTPTTCPTAITAYQSALALPPASQAAAIRALLP